MKITINGTDITPYLAKQGEAIQGMILMVLMLVEQWTEQCTEIGLQSKINGLLLVDL